MTIDNIINLIDKVNVKDKVKIEEMLISFIDYTSFAVEKNIDSMINKDDYTDDIKEKYCKCVENIKRLNNISISNNLERLFTGSFEDEKETNEFILLIVTEFFKNRRAVRK